MVSKVLKVYESSGSANAAGKIIAVPQVRLQGKWVEDLGFTAGSRFRLLADNGIIILKILAKEA